MPELTRRRSDNQHQEVWHVYYGDIHVGTIAARAGVPIQADQWSWGLGFYPGMDYRKGGNAATFEEARAAFERAWKDVQPTLTQAQFEEWRRSRDFHAWKQRMWDERYRMPTQNENGWSKCFCGEPIPIACEEHIHTVHRGIGA
ncbi:hypothetical protein AB7M16_000011 [Bradyrhizobium sp. USDA 372]